MKKPLLAAAGVIGACAACCTIPLAIPLLGGLSVAGLVGIEWNALSRELFAAIAGLGAAALIGAALWWKRRSSVVMACAVSAPGGGSGCGCSGKPKPSIEARP